MGVFHGGLHPQINIKAARLHDSELESLRQDFFPALSKIFLMHELMGKAKLTNSSLKWSKRWLDDLPDVLWKSHQKHAIVDEFIIIRLQLTCNDSSLILHAPRNTGPLLRDIFKQCIAHWAYIWSSSNWGCIKGGKSITFRAYVFICSCNQY